MSISWELIKNAVFQTPIPDLLNQDMHFNKIPGLLFYALLNLGSTGLGRLDADLDACLTRPGLSSFDLFEYLRMLCF